MMSMANQTNTMFNPIITHLISNDAYKQLTDDWKKIADPFNPDPASVDLGAYFTEKDYLQFGVGFDQETMLLFLSTTGLKTVNIRFGLDINDQTFKLIMFGVDATSARITPYIVGSPLFDFQYNPIEIIENNHNYTGYISKALAESWINNWKSKGREANSSFFRLSNYTSPYWLQGYNYSMREFIDALYPDTSAGDIFVSFVLHQYFAKDCVSTNRNEKQEYIYTFGLVFQGVNRKLSNDGSSGDLIVSGGYYDFTAPCPPTCGGNSN